MAYVLIYTMNTTTKTNDAWDLFYHIRATLGSLIDTYRDSNEYVFCVFVIICPFDTDDLTIDE